MKELKTISLVICVILGLFIPVLGDKVDAGAPILAQSRLQLQGMLPQPTEVRAVLGPDWLLLSKAELNYEPDNSITAAFIYGNGQQLMLTALYQFRESAQARNFFELPYAPGELQLSQVNGAQSPPLKAKFAKAEAVEIVVFRLFDRPNPHDDRLNMTIRFQVDRLVSLIEMELCIPNGEDRETGFYTPRHCFKESDTQNMLIAIARMQLEILFNSREKGP